MIPHPVDLFERLIARDTTSARSNRPLVDDVANWFDRPGIRLERLLSPDGAKENLLASTGPLPTGDRSGLLLCGHTDVVPAGEGWTSDPFSLTDRGETWVARGACDMKGFLALAIEALLVAAERTDRLRAPLALLLTYDEEVGTLGAQQFVRACGEPERLPRDAWIGEPTSLSIVRRHKGHLKLRIEMRGKSAHSSLPHLGKSAIEIAGRVIPELVRLRQALESERGESSRFFPEAPFVTLNLGRIEGGMAVNIVPDRCTIDLGLRPLPSQPGEPEGSQALAERVIEAVRRVAPEDAEVTITGESPPLDTPAASRLARLLAEETGAAGERGAPFASDGGPLQSLGVRSVLFGPGAIEVAHRPDEFLPKAEFEVARALLARVVERMCGDAARAPR